MRSLDIRRCFLDFFREHDHRLVPASGLVPDDPSMLLTGAGMVQFLPYFAGESDPPAPRLTTAQPCVRTVDIDGIGRTDRHGTAFEMLGAFSFGDYDAPDAVPWIWELLTGRLGVDRARLWVTVYRDDEATAQLWRGLGVPEERIQRLGMADNYWTVGRPGPCGPCTEIFYDRGPRYGRDGGPALDQDRFLELGNIVLTREIRGEGGTDDCFPVVGTLERPGIDIGLGTERIAMALQGSAHFQAIDLFLPSMRRLDALVGRVGSDGSGGSGGSGDSGRSRDGAYDLESRRVVVDHLHAATLLIAEGVRPGPGRQGYVLRRMIRRALVRLRRLGLPPSALGELTGSVLDGRAEFQPALVDGRAVVEGILAGEAQAYDRAIRQGSRLLRRAIRRTRERGESVLPGEAAFELYDAAGLPLELTVELARESGLEVDVARFDTLLDEHRARSS